VEQEFLEPGFSERGLGTRFLGFQDLMKRRIRDVLLVSSLYDLYLFEEDGRLYELIRNEYQGLHLSHSPEITRVSTGSEALLLLQEENRFDLVITTLHIEDMTALKLARMVRQSGSDIPLVLLAYDNRELNDLLTHHDVSVFNRIFIWQGDYRLIIGIVKHLEDRKNVQRDTEGFGVQVILFVEDNIRYYSSFLPIIYSEVLNQSRRLISEGMNLSHKSLRMRARPKILLCTTFEEAWDYLEKYEDNILGVISDVDFPKEGKADPQAGILLAKSIRQRYTDIPILLQSNSLEYQAQAHAIGASFLLKDSPTIINDLRQFMIQNFSFGDFVFRGAEGHEVGRAVDLTSLEEQLHYVPDESIRYHAERNHFSNWLKARTEFWLAHQLRPRKVSDYASVADLRADLIRHLREYRRVRQRGLVTEFSKETYDPNTSFARLGGGSLGGKARGLGFVNLLINSYGLREKFEGVQIEVPPALVIGTEVFDQFLDDNGLRHFALTCSDDDEIARRFLGAQHFSQDILTNLAAFLDLSRDPLAVRSSSVLEDSQYHPFAGVYLTTMIPNNNPDDVVRLGELINAIKRVYASTFYQSAKDYIKVTSYRLEEEKMAVVIQRLVGSQHGDRFYPTISGVAKSYNFYPVAPQRPQDGIVAVALGLGKIIVDGGMTVRFSPRYPNHLLQMSSPLEALKSNQSEFYALDMTGSLLTAGDTGDVLVKSHTLAEAESDGTLHFVASTYSHENNALYDGLSRSGTRVVTLAPVLRNKLFPLAGIVETLAQLGSWGMGTPVEIEFAVNLSAPPDAPKKFGILQMRPLVLSRETEELNIEDLDPSKLICHSHQVLGHGAIHGLHDVVVVDTDRFDRARSRDVAKEVMLMNEALIAEGRPYLLIGVGRWGSLDPWLGIPVKWDQISGAKTIVEGGFKDMNVDPSQGSHFFQNITSFMVGYFTVNSKVKQGFVDWDWLARQPALEEKEFVRHLRFEHPIVVKMNGHTNEGIILKPQ
jgi:CheY-like chemotaxis protein